MKLNLTQTDEEIKEVKKHVCSATVKKQVKRQALQELNEECMKKPGSPKPVAALTPYKDLKIQHYPTKPINEKDSINVQNSSKNTGHKNIFV